MRADFEIAAMIIVTKASDWSSGDYCSVRPDDDERIDREDCGKSLMHKVSCYLCATEVQRYFWLRKKYISSVIQNTKDRSIWVWATPSSKQWRGRPS